eukprot:6767305-Alexandrium_andersonii.AAC.1
MLRGDRSGNGPDCTVRCSGARSSGEREVAGVAVRAVAREVVPAGAGRGALGPDEEQVAPGTVPRDVAEGVGREVAEVDEVHVGAVEKGPAKASA